MDAEPTLDLLLTGATVLTADPPRALVRNAIVGIANDRIALLDEATAVPARPAATRALDLTGRVITPGFVNVHTHAALTLVRGVAEDLGFAPAYSRGIPRSAGLHPDDAAALARMGALEAMLFGSTTVNDSYIHADAIVAAIGELGLRVHVSERIHDADFEALAEGRWEHCDAIGDRTLGAAIDVAERWHGRDHGRISVQLTAHAPDTCSEGLLRRIREASLRHGLVVNTHLAQSRAEVERVRTRSGCSPAALLDRVGLLDSRLIAAHCVFLDDEDIARVGRAGINVAHVPKGNATAGMMAPTSRLRAAGARLALGTDNMHADMIETMRWALAVGRLQERAVTNAWQPVHVLEMATLRGAQALGLQDRIGTLAVGKKADLVAIDFRRPHLTPCVNPLGNLVHVAQGRDVELVVVDGRIVVEGGVATRVDQEEVRRDAEGVARRLWEQAARE
jgi:5-methylthioadenosine/S-adenosylhomocysteine deaminase